MLSCASLVSRMPLMLILYSNSYILLNLCLDIMPFSFGVKDPFVIMNVYPTCYLVEEPKLLFAAKALHVPCLILNHEIGTLRCLCLKNMLPCHMCFKFLIFGAKPLHDVYHWEISYLEVDTWLGVFDMTWYQLRANSSSIDISTYQFHDLQIKHGTWSAFAAKRSLGFSTR